MSAEGDDCWRRFLELYEKIKETSYWSDWTFDTGRKMLEIILEAVGLGLIERDEIEDLVKLLEVCLEEHGEENLDVGDGEGREDEEEEEGGICLYGWWKLAEDVEGKEEPTSVVEEFQRTVWMEREDVVDDGDYDEGTVEDGGGYTEEKEDPNKAEDLEKLMEVCLEVVGGENLDVVDGEGREDGDGRKYTEKGEKAVSCGEDDEKIWLANVSEDRVIKSGRFRKIGH